MFESVKCSRCGGELTETGYSLPYPQLRCVSCIKRNAERKKLNELKDKLAKMEERVAHLETLSSSVGRAKD